ncbi:FecCD family ABC transporter permease [Gordonia sp. (in: high G+C Gram-positive bacteria)]|uniref:FecCD family ABC transporter permease n=1 Tax=Gordonia sp. (in: high G+C Gram-positive bacteria) TaxID=84139 RepID=UPI003F9CB8B3
MTTTSLAPGRSAAFTVVRQARRRRRARRGLVVAGLLLAVLAAIVVSLTYGRTYYPPADVIDVIVGKTVPGASYTVGTLRLPRTTLAVVAGACFGLGGAAFQVMLRNPLASPDIIGISAGASTAATFAVVVLSLSGTMVSVFAIVAALVVALVVYLLSYRGGSASARLVLIGIGIAAMLYSATSYILTLAADWDLQAATRWLSGSLNNAAWPSVVPVVIALAVLGPVLVGLDRTLRLLQIGDEIAASLGVRVDRSRLLTTVVAVVLIAFATSAAGPIAFAAFLAGPIAVRLLGPAGGAPLLPAALVGSLLVTIADFCGQFAFDNRFPVGVVTGVLGAPYLVYLIVRSNRSGGAL